ncbi:hypothetical protein [Nocardia sp. NBC_00416]|uniref:hypothetical protein n=1 Tax=Nocardia sp. NBC_00416 TaxID=2975991 RepID=UPI002E1EFD0D
MLTFDTVIELGGKTATGFRVPARVVEELGSGRKPRVCSGRMRISVTPEVRVDDGDGCCRGDNGPAHAREPKESG